ncbi:MAG: hypothetical protein ACYDBQ_02080 [Thermoplasmatota archaeon]
MAKRRVGRPGEPNPEIRKGGETGRFSHAWGPMGNRKHEAAMEELRDSTMAASPVTSLDLATEISSVTRREPDILTRSGREVRAAMDEGRVAVRCDAEGLLAFLFLHRYGPTYEVGTGWVRPDHRRRGLFVALHHELFARLAPGTRIFGFPGNPGVRRAMQQLGFRRQPYSVLPMGVWVRLALGRLGWAKLASLSRSLRSGTMRTSRELWLLTVPEQERGGKN